jgi:hypothetical protein
MVLQGGYILPVFYIAFKGLYMPSFFIVIFSSSKKGVSAQHPYHTACWITKRTFGRSDGYYVGVAGAVGGIVIKSRVKSFCAGKTIIVIILVFEYGGYSSIVKRINMYFLVTCSCFLWHRLLRRTLVRHSFMRRRNCSSFSFYGSILNSSFNSGN